LTNVAGTYQLTVTWPSQSGQSIRGSNVAARQPDGTVVTKTFLRNVRVVMIHDQPLMELTRQTVAE
jgi:hypothetical protein